ncbi:MAG: hypothetical protein AAFV98_17160 [Chloroflexota bacterium]
MSKRRLSLGGGGAGVSATTRLLILPAGVSAWIVLLIETLFDGAGDCTISSASGGLATASRISESSFIGTVSCVTRVPAAIC